MKLQSELSMTVLGFTVLNLALAFVSIGLFARMGPAIERILVRNDATIEAAEEVMAVFAAAPGTAIESRRREQVEGALGRIVQNVTETAEPQAIAEIEESLAHALDGDAAARANLVAALQRLLAVNRGAMLDADREAQRLGSAGAWAAAIVAILSLGLGFALGRRLVRRVVLPVVELRQVLVATQAGDRFRRCGAHDTPREIHDAMLDLNKLLDDRDAGPIPDAAAETQAAAGGEPSLPGAGGR